MKNQFTAVIEKDGEWYVAFCPEIPGANGQGEPSKNAGKICRNLSVHLP